MIFVKDKFYAYVKKVNKQEKYIDLQIMTSEKDKSGDYINSYWFSRAIGHAFNSLSNVKPEDRIVVTKCKITNELYTAKDGKTKTSLSLVILEAQNEEFEGTNAKSENKTESVSKQSEEESPW